MGGRSVLHETLSALDRMQALDLRRKEVEEILAHEHSGPAHDAALEEFGEVLTELEHHDFYSAESRATSVLFGLGFTDATSHRDVAEFSGGIRMRIALAKLLLDAPDFMMLDEPTNHLDIEARNWLEDYLVAYQGGIILVSHDRYFLDRVTEAHRRSFARAADRIRRRLLALSGAARGTLRARDGGVRTAARRNRAHREFHQPLPLPGEQGASWCRAASSNSKRSSASSRRKDRRSRHRFRFRNANEARAAFSNSRARSRRYGALTVYDGVDLTIERGARIALVGPNGSGKSTMMKMLAGVEPMTGGERIVGASVQAGYFAQNLAESLNYDKTVLDELSDSAQSRSMGELRSMLGAMLFSGDDVYKRVAVLSGGERARLALAKVLAHPSNCLLLDEPTNNLDIVAKDTLLEALRRFPGTVIIVSHDRFILNELVTEVLEVGQGHAIRYLGNYDEYLEKKAQTEASSPASQATRSAPVHLRDTRGNNGTAPQAKKAEAPKAAQPSKEDREASRKRDRIAKQRGQIEAEIEQKENERAALATEMNDPNFYLARKDADDLIARYEQLGREIEQLYADLVKFDEAASA